MTSSLFLYNLVGATLQKPIDAGSTFNFEKSSKIIALGKNMSNELFISRVFKHHHATSLLFLKSVEILYFTNSFNVIIDLWIALEPSGSKRNWLVVRSQKLDVIFNINIESHTLYIYKTLAFWFSGKNFFYKLF